MAVLIKGMEMPKEGFVEIIIRDDGTVQQTGQSYRIDGTDYYTPYIGEMPVMYKATPVHEPHGRLGDLTSIEAQLDYIANLDWNKQVGASGGMLAALEVVEDAPTIIPADSNASNTLKALGNAEEGE